MDIATHLLLGSRDNNTQNAIAVCDRSNPEEGIKFSYFDNDQCLGPTNLLVTYEDEFKENDTMSRLPTTNFLFGCTIGPKGEEKIAIEHPLSEKVIDSLKNLDIKKLLSTAKAEGLSQFEIGALEERATRMVDFAKDATTEQTYGNLIEATYPPPPEGENCELCVNGNVLFYRWKGTGSTDEVVFLESGVKTLEDFEDRFHLTAQNKEEWDSEAERQDNPNYSEAATNEELIKKGQIMSHLGINDDDVTSKEDSRPPHMDFDTEKSNLDKYMNTLDELDDKEREVFNNIMNEMDSSLDFDKEVYDYHRPDIDEDDRHDLYERLYERSPHRIADLIVRLQTQPKFDLLWTTRLMNGRTVRIQVHAENPRSWEFAHAYHWHDVEIRDLEWALLRRFTDEGVADIHRYWRQYGSTFPAAVGDGITLRIV